MVVWVELSEPVPAGATSAVEAERRARRVEQQQQQTRAALRSLGAVELARLRHTRNAIAVRIAADRLEAVRALPGVLHVRPTEGLHPPELMNGASAPRTQPR